jgi:hypothetical protein
MKLIRQVKFDDLLQIFAQENHVKDGLLSDRSEKDDWPRARIKEANEAANGEWYEYSFDQVDLANIFVHWNTEFDTPKAGIMIGDALKLPSVQIWLGSEKAKNLTQESHLWLSRNFILHDSSREMKPPNGVFYLLDGVHRSILWAHQHREPVLVFMAGKQPGNPGTTFSSSVSTQN